MHKLGRREYLKMLCETLVSEYGGTLTEGDTDLDMAEAVMRKMRKYLFFHSRDMSAADWKKWRRKFLSDCGNDYGLDTREIRVPGKLR